MLETFNQLRICQPVSGIWSAKCQQRWTGWGRAAPLNWYVVAWAISVEQTKMFLWASA